MARADTTLERMRANPRDWRIEDVEAVARSFGVAIRRPKGGSSHVSFKHPSVAAIETVPARRPIKPEYIKSFVAFIDKVRR